MRHLNVIPVLAVVAAVAACTSSSTPPPAPANDTAAPTTTTPSYAGGANAVASTSTAAAYGGTASGTTAGVTTAPAGTAAPLGTTSTTPGVAGTTTSSLTTTGSGLPGGTTGSTGSTVPTAGPVSLTPNCSASSDYWQLTYPSGIESCLGQGLLYDFSDGSCSTMARSPFPCDYTDAETALQNDGLDISGVQAQQAAGAKLVNCGSTTNGFTIVLQFVSPTAGSSCQYAAGQIQTSCFQRVESGETPATSGSSCLTAQ